MAPTNPLLSLLGDTARDEGPILEAALEQFALTGVRRTSTDDIARRAGVNRATLYRRLGTKNAIVNAAFLYEAGRVLAAIDAEVGDVGAGADGAHGYIERFFVITVSALRSNRLLRQLLAVDREETLRGLTVGAADVLEVSSQYLAGKIHRIREHIGGSTDGAEIAAISGMLARLTQSLLVTPDGPPPTRTEAEMRRFARVVLVPMLLGR
ncbi:helix-turn-helix transcriptional regulator [Mycolicibacillus parakoreensis]|uniref:TetR/AcrR family transcriptional regulator n=1 Tax=Mycolicibacillus parakoreensis TaxID=1069221 RepID=A0ABY3U2K1_9MYCO|nr:TetR/AcrR family transcriptional regulator [Mycolicibacillus parakoreensis]MCV7314176.1 helix-turn-helix transcriptional regulator [Mycolicibacillus parakoreensis]ULN52896.1 TetR/AcrR family transcriptional regulator [Mycolicibacillus parakoreensis]